MQEKRDLMTVETVADMQSIVRGAKEHGLTVGCVPTMGYLHDGHASLIRRAAEKNDLVIVSIFVNPTQFGPNEDFERYPRDLDRDLTIIRQSGGTHVFVPSVIEMYPDGARSTIHIDGVTEVLEGAARPTHFDGVATVVSRLFEAMQPTVAYFGQKDYQQILVIRRMVECSPIAAVHSVTIEELPTMREDDGLARSSRNVYLSDTDRHDASVIYAALRAGADLLAGGERRLPTVEAAMRARLSELPRLNVEYAVAVDASTLRPPQVIISGMTIALLIAARLGTTRLIDNVLVPIDR